MKFEISMTVSSRHYFSLSHIEALKRFVALAEETEAKSGLPGINHVRSFSMYSVISAVCLVESAINEFFSDIAEGNLGGIQGLKELLKDEQFKRVSEAWKVRGVEKLSISEKYHLALCLLDKEPFHIGAAPYQDMVRLIELRNYLVHYKPESIYVASTVDKQEEIQGKISKSQKISEKLRGKFEGCRLFEGIASPDKITEMLGAGCARWSLETSRSFVSEFFVRVGVEGHAELYLK